MSEPDPRDPRLDPHNGDALLREDLSGPQRIRVCHGCNVVEVDGKKVCWVRYELPLRRGQIRTTHLEEWAEWATPAEVLDEDGLVRCLMLWGIDPG